MGLGNASRAWEWITIVKFPLTWAAHDTSPKEAFPKTNRVQAASSQHLCSSLNWPPLPLPGYCNEPTQIFLPLLPPYDTWQHYEHFPHMIHTNTMGRSSFTAAATWIGTILFPIMPHNQRPLMRLGICGGLGTTLLGPPLWSLNPSMEEDPTTLGQTESVCSGKWILLLSCPF